MRHTIIYVLLILAVVVTGSLPFDQSDVGKLRPVQTLYGQWADGQVRVTADTGDRGQGDDWQSAIEALEAAAPGTVFQGAVSYILLEEPSLLPQILEVEALNPSCVVCLAPPGLDLEEAGTYLDAHEPESSLRLLRAGAIALPRLAWTEGRFFLIGAEN